MDGYLYPETRKKNKHENLANNNRDDEEDNNNEIILMSQPVDMTSHKMLNFDNIELDSTKAAKAPTLAEISGGYGFYPISVTIICFIRYVCLAMMTNSGSLLAPDLEYSCLVPKDLESQIVHLPNETLSETLKNKCSLKLTNGLEYKCVRWSFNTSSTGSTLTDSLSLVCDSNWYRSAFQSAVSLGVVAAALVWGPLSDELGRLFSIRVCFIWSLFWGLTSYFAENFSLYALARAFCTIGDIGLVSSMSLVAIELVSDRLRGVTLIIVYTGWSLGVMIMPWITDYFRDYKYVTLFTVFCHVLTLPFVIYVGESVRWMMTDGRFVEAKRELERIRAWNLKVKSNNKENFNQEFDHFKLKYQAMANNRSSGKLDQVAKTRLPSPMRILRTLIGSYSHFGEFFQSKSLAVSASSIIWISFNAELFYMLFVMINSDIGGDLKTNYAMGFLMELVATFIGLFMTTYISRRLSLASTIAAISGSCFLLAFMYHDPKLSMYIMNFAKIAISNLTSLVWVTSNEIFPTNLRQTGNGLTGALGSMGAVVAPFVRTELIDMIGMKSVMLILVVTSTSAGLVTFILRETKDRDLPDSLEEMDNDAEHSKLDDRNTIHIPSITC